MTHPTLRALEYWAMRYRRTWRGTVIISIVSPVFFLAALGLGLGGVISTSGGSVGGGNYLHFLAPGLLAASAMQTAIGESTWPVMASIKWIKTYDAMLATPLRVGDVLGGHLSWIGIRLTIPAVAFVAVAAAFGAWPSALVLLAVPAAVLTGLAFAAPAMAFAASLDSDTGFVLLYRLGVIPLFLFSGTFFPLGQLPAWMQDVARVTPLWHGVTLCRSFAAGVTGLGDLGHVAYLLAWTAAGTALAAWRYSRRLVR